jgi:hypothetical protein
MDPTLAFRAGLQLSIAPCDLVVGKRSAAASCGTRPLPLCAVQIYVTDWSPRTSYGAGADRPSAAT